MDFNRQSALEEMRSALRRHTRVLVGDLNALMESFIRGEEVSVKDITSKFKELKGFLKDLEYTKSRLEEV